MKFSFWLFTIALVGCSSSEPYVPDATQLDVSNLPTPNISTSIANLSNCTDSADNAININSDEPLTILVHGCKSSAGRFRSLAQLYAFHGQQAICYSYDDRGSLVDAAEKLATAVDELTEVSNPDQRITIIGHSMGGLVARKSLEENTNYTNILSDKNLDLITISAPISGIEAAKHCGVPSLNWLSAGIIPGVCWLVTGDNWSEITYSSPFIQNPEPLIPAVSKYLKIVTNEENTCRRVDDKGRCIESDYVFNLAEQQHPKIDNYHNIIGVEVDAGHVEIVGNKQIVPRKLLSVLQENGALSYTPDERKNALEILFAQLY